MHVKWTTTTGIELSISEMNRYEEWKQAGN